MQIRELRYPPKNASTNWRGGSGASGWVQNKLHNNTDASKTDYDAPKWKCVEGVIRRKHHYRNIAQACRNGNSKLSIEIGECCEEPKEGLLQVQRQPKNQGYHGQLTDTGHEKGWCTQCLLHLGLYWQDEASWLSVHSGRWEVLPTTAEEDESRDHFGKLDTYKNVDGPRWDASEYTLRDQAKVITRLLSIIFEKAWQSGKVPMTGRRQMSHLPSKRGRKKIQITKGQSDSPQSMERL